MRESYRTLSWTPSVVDGRRGSAPQRRLTIQPLPPPPSRVIIERMPPRRRSQPAASAPPPAAPAVVKHFRPHPWHGLEVGPQPPALLNAYIEITPFDLMKYEVDKASGYLRVDRPQRSSAQHPSLYGFVPRT